LAHPSRAPVRALLVAGLFFSSGSTSAQAGPQAAAPAVDAGAAVAVLAAQAQRDSIVAVARRQIGRRYVFGGTSPEQGFDCSGFLRYLMRAVGRDLPRTAAQQAQVGAEVPRDPALLRPGDILTFGRGRRITHVAVYVGEGRYIHASSGAGRIVESELDRPQSALVRAWAGVRRLLSPEADASVAVRPDATPVSPAAPLPIRGG
jgi:cell wall-associated NlpC family hydrolase